MRVDQGVAIVRESAIVRNGSKRRGADVDVDPEKKHLQGLNGDMSSQVESSRGPGLQLGPTALCIANGNDLRDNFGGACVLPLAGVLGNRPKEAHGTPRNKTCSHVTKTRHLRFWISDEPVPRNSKELPSSSARFRPVPLGSGRFRGAARIPDFADFDGSPRKLKF